MDKLERVFGHIGNASPDELRNRVRQIRSDRRISKVKASTVKKAKRAAASASDKSRAKASKLVKTVDLDLLMKIMREQGHDC